eukprot:6209779-Pleurochrysis_carterae.AAC.4
MDIHADVKEHGLNTVMQIAELDVKAAMNAAPSQLNKPDALTTRMKRAFYLSAKAHTTSRLEESQERLQRLMKVMVSQMKHVSTREKTFQRSFLHMTRKEQPANTAPLVALDDFVKGLPRARGRREGSW